MLRFFLCAILALSVNALVVRKTLPTDLKIVGGRTVDIEEYAYHVAVIQDSVLWCSGSIITPKDVLTAGHCVFFATSDLTVHAGSAFWQKPGSVHQVIANDTISSEPNADIAILHVDKAFQFDSTRQAIKLFTEGETAPTGAYAVVTGWGLDQDEDGKVLTQLAAADVPLIDRETCNRDYAGTVIGGVRPGQLCAGDGEKGPCRGDSGGPLVFNQRQIGIVSRGKGCASSEYPSIYTDVAFHSKWINQNVSP